MASHFEQTRKSLESLLQSADKGKALFEDLRKFSFETTFGVDELANASSQLINAGVATKDLREQLKMLGDVAQGDKGKFAELTSVFAKVQLMGKAGAQTISQFNIRGVPLNKTLKEMGVVGTASAKQVTEALQKLTAEGGQFHDAMNNIIDTIEGKRGFIDDTINEIKVNLGEVTGLTEAYKASLDAMYEVYEKINKKLMEWNKNPVMQAIIRGTIVGGITAIGLAITTAVIPALFKTIAQLKFIATLKAMINPAGLLVGLGISAVVGLGVAVKTIADNEKIINDELIEQIKHRQTLGEIPLTATTDEKSDYLKTLEEQLKQYQQLQKTTVQKYTSGVFEGYFDTLADYERLIKIEEDKLANFSKRGITKGTIESVMNANGKIERIDTRTQQQKQLDETEKNLFRLKNTYNNLKKSYSTNLYYKSLQKNIEGLTKEIELQKELEATTKKIDDYSPWTKQEQEIKELQTQLEEINKMYEQVGVKSKKLNEETGEYEYTYDLLINIDPSYKQRLEEVKKAIEKELEDAEIKFKLSKMTEWQKELQNALGLDDKTTSSLIGKNGDKWVEKALEIRDNQKKLRDNTYRQLGIKQGDKKDVKADITNQVKEILSIIEPLVNGNKFGAVNAGGKLDNTFEKFNTELENLKKKFIKNGGTLDEWDKIVGNTTEETDKLAFNFQNVSKSIGDKLIDTVKSQTKLGSVFDAVTSAMTGDVEGFTNAILQIISQLTIFQDMMSALDTIWTAIDDVFSTLKPFVKIINTIIYTVSDYIYEIVGILEIIMEVLSPFISLFRLLFTAIRFLHAGLSKLIENIRNWISKTKWGKLAKASEKLADSFDEYVESMSRVKTAKEEEEAQIKKLIQQYEELMTSMKEQEEYYYNMQKSLISESYKDKVMNVNDMIITPQGNFSTSPDDYIIATKKPSQLGGGSTVVQNKIEIKNEMGSVANVKVQEVSDEQGFNKLLVTISQKVASDYANGYNGWKQAVALQGINGKVRRIQ